MAKTCVSHPVSGREEGSGTDHNCPKITSVCLCALGSILKSGSLGECLPGGTTAATTVAKKVSVQFSFYLLVPGSDLPEVHDRPTGSHSSNGKVVRESRVAGEETRASTLGAHRVESLVCLEIPKFLHDFANTVDLHLILVLPVSGNLLRIGGV